MTELSDPIKLYYYLIDHDCAVITISNDKLSESDMIKKDKLFLQEVDLLSYRAIKLQNKKFFDVFKDNLKDDKDSYYLLINIKCKDNFVKSIIKLTHKYSDTCVLIKEQYNEIAHSYIINQKSEFIYDRYYISIFNGGIHCDFMRRLGNITI